VGAESLGVRHESIWIMCLDSPNRPSHRCQRDASHYLRRFPFLDLGLRTFTRGSWANHPAIWSQMYARDPFRLGVTTSRGGRCSTTSFNFLLNRSTFVRQLPRLPQGRVIFSACLRLPNFFSLPSDSFLSCLVAVRTHTLQLGARQSHQNTS
jgi:hypothetical protein